MLKHIARHTNLNSSQQNVARGNIAIGKDEIEKYTGILLKMFIIQAPYYRLYWETDTSMTTYVP